MKKRILSSLLALCMVLALLPGTTLAASVIYSGTCGDDISWTLDNSGKLTISGTGKMDDFHNGAPWHSEIVKEVVIGNGVTSIGLSAFSGCTTLTSVTIPDSMREIGSGAFLACTSLTSITIPGNVTSIGDWAFNGCSSLTGIAIPNGVTSIKDFTFYDCSSLTSVTIPNSVTSIEFQAFHHCSSLTSITIPDSVTSIRRQAFSDCSSLTSITIPDSVTSIEEYTFARCSSLTSITIPDSVTSIGNEAFIECSSLTSITIPDSVREIGAAAFFNCQKISDVYYSGTNAQWKAITIAPSNDPLTTATIHFLGEEAKSYSLRFYPDGGTGNLPEPAFYKAGEVITLSVAPTREGYIFAGWSDGQKTYQPGARFTMPEKNVTLTAQWTPYTPPVYPMLSYDLKGGTGTLPGATPYAAGTTIKISDVIPIHDVVFLGWYCADRPDQVYLPGDSFTMPDHDVVLGAVWGGRIPILEYNLNGGTGKNIPRPENKIHGEMVIVTMSIPELEGYRFIGWSDKKEGGTKLYSPGDFFNMPNMDTVLFAQWKKLCSLGFDPDGGTGYLPGPAFYVEGELVTLPSAPSKNGLAFAGWSDGLHTYPAGSQFSMPGNDLILTAQWKKTYDVQKAIEYARGHWNDGYGACANFVSRCVIAGGLDMNVENGTGGCARAICAASGLEKENLILRKGYNDAYHIYKSDNPSLEAGDVVLEWCESCNVSPHVLICGGFSSRGFATFYSHNPALNNYANKQYYVFNRHPLHPGHNMGSKVIRLSTLSKETRRLTSTTFNGACPIEMTVRVGSELLDSRTISEGVISKNGAVMEVSGIGQTRRVSTTVPAQYIENSEAQVSLYGTDTGTMTMTITDSFNDGSKESYVFQNVSLSKTTTGHIEIMQPGLLMRLVVEDSTTGKADTWTALTGEILTAPDTEKAQPSTPVIPSTSTSSGSNSSSGSDVPAYQISLPSNIIGGKLSVTPSSASSRQKVTLTARPDSGYQLNNLTVTDSKGNELKLTDKGNGKYTFTMPASKVNVDATFVKIEAPIQPATPAISFTDVDPGAYYYDAIAWAVEEGITVGTSATTFSPDVPCTRAQIVTFLWRTAGSPVMGGNNPFTDVASGSYYYDAVQWAVAQGITAGTGATTFSPDAACTRGQTVTFLYRYEKSPAVSGGNAFTDIDTDAYYANAVQWAVNKGVTAGTSATTFNPNGDCTRAQIVTFLYRDRTN